MLNTTEHVISIAHKKVLHACFYYLESLFFKIIFPKEKFRNTFKYLMSVFSVCSQNVLKKFKVTISMHDPR